MLARISVRALTVAVGGLAAGLATGGASAYGSEVGAKCSPGTERLGPPPISDTEAVGRLQAMTMGYIARHVEPGKPTIRNVLGERRTRDNLIAAIGYAETGNAPAAEAVLAEVLASQNLDRSSPRYGSFAAMLGGDLTNLPESTSVLFGASFVAILLDRHGQTLSPETVARLRTALAAAATGASRMPQPPLLLATNQALLQAHAVLRGGEILDDQRLIAAGVGLWQKFHRFTLTHGFPEANSPNYTKVMLYTLGFMVDHLRDAEVRRQARGVRDLVWWSLSRHFHSPTRQLSGPFSRSLTDRMAYELSGVHLSMFRESGGRIALPGEAVLPSGNQYQDVGNAETPLHAVLATLFAPSWPPGYLGLALCKPTARGYQFRERTTTWPLPHRAGSKGIEQYTAYHAPSATLGTRSRDSQGISLETRPVVAYTSAPDGSVGTFRLQVPDPRRHTLGAVTAQNRGSAAVAIVVNLYRPETTRRGEVTLEWRGTPAHPPVLRTRPRRTRGGQARVSMMGTTTTLRFAGATPVPSPAPRLRVTRPDQATLRLTWSGPLPRARGADGYNPTQVVLMAFGLHMQTGGIARSLSQVSLGKDAKAGWSRLSWRSPAGQLLSRFDTGLNAVTSLPRVNGRAVSAPKPRVPPST